MKRHQFLFARAAVIAAIFSGAGAGVTSAYIGPSFLRVNGIAGGWPGATYKDWIKIEAHYWGQKRRQSNDLRRMFYSGPAAPREGAGQLSIAIDKRSPALTSLMDLCTKKGKLGELRYAESSEMARRPPELGPRPSSIPEYFEYTLTDVALTCPVVPDAPEQAFVLRFAEIKWLNYVGEGEALAPPAAPLPPGQASGKSKTYVLTWFSSATDAEPGEIQCRVGNSRPREDDYYALVPKEEAARERAERDPKGGVSASPTDGQLALRGPDKLDACGLPGIVRDPGHVSPQTGIPHGFNLDGKDGIDNQLFNVDGCIAGFKRNGLLSMSRAEARRNGLLSILVDIAGIDNDQNDDSVDVTVIYSRDAMAKNADGSQILPAYTFRVSDDPELTHLFTRFHGRIVNGVVVTDPLGEITLHNGREPRITLYDARMRLEFLPDGSLKGVIGGYQEWRILMNFWASYSSGFEAYMGYQCPGVYNAFKRAADGLKDPVTGEYNGVSAAYDMEGVAAFIPPEQRKALMPRR